MSKTHSGLFMGTLGDLAFPGSTSFMKSDDPFGRYIRRRKDVDVRGFFDVVAHGESALVLVEHHGTYVRLDHRSLARLITQASERDLMGVRLLSCNTGTKVNGLAQNLANKLKVPVKAPNSYLWAKPDGTYFVAEGKMQGQRLVADMTRPGKFVTFYPKRRK